MWILLLSVVTLFEYNVSTILLPIVGKKALSLPKHLCSVDVVLVCLFLFLDRVLVFLLALLTGVTVMEVKALCT